MAPGPVRCHRPRQDLQGAAFSQALMAALKVTAVSCEPSSSTSPIARSLARKAPSGPKAPAGSFFGGSKSLVDAEKPPGFLSGIEAPRKMSSKTQPKRTPRQKQHGGAGPVEQEVHHPCIQPLSRSPKKATRGEMRPKKPKQTNRKKCWLIVETKMLLFVGYC